MVPFKIKDGRAIVYKEVADEIGKSKASSGSGGAGDGKHGGASGKSRDYGKSRTKEHHRDGRSKESSKGRKIRSRKAAALGRKDEVRSCVATIAADVLELVTRELQVNEGDIKVHSCFVSV